MRNKIIQIKTIHCTINMEIKYYYNKKGKITGVKSLNNQDYIYLIELLNYSKIWLFKQEFTFVKNILQIRPYAIHNQRSQKNNFFSNHK